MSGKKEKWVPLEIDGIKKGMYEISDRGKIYSKKSKKYLKPIKKHNGYYRVNLSLEKGGQKEFSIHRLVAICFIDLPDGYIMYDDLQVNHKKGDKSKNKASDLEWMTSSENITHSIKHGLQKIKYGDESNNHKYDSKLVTEICKALEKGYRGKKLLDYLGLDDTYKNLIRRIKERRHWTDISKYYDF